MRLKEFEYIKSVANTVIHCCRRFSSKLTPASAWKSLALDQMTFVFALSLAAAFGCSEIRKTRLANQSNVAVQSTTRYGEAQRTDPADIDAVELMRKVVAVYHGLSTYSDKGTAIVQLGGDDSRYTVDFETLFKRPGKLRFAWTVRYKYTPGHIQRAVIWSDGTSVWAWASFRGNKPVRKPSLDVVVAGATGASWGAAHSVPRLLTDEVGGIRLDELQVSKVMGNDTADGVDCTIVGGYLPAGTERKIWVSRTDHLIRRIEERSKDETREEIRTQIVVNQEIPDSRFSEGGR